MAIKKMKTKNTEKIEDIYQKMSPHEHVLALPDTYIGSIEEDTAKMWVYEGGSMVFKTINYVPGLYKIFDEIAVNARDHSVKDPTCKTIRITIDQELGQISFMNDGKNGIPVAMHKEEKMYVPEMIFSHLLTSGNYKQKGKIVGGKNGYGAKLCLKKGTLIPTFSGEIKKVEEIGVGDELIGDDGTPRKVLAKTEGNDRLYKIHQQRCDPYVVNGEHLLCLQHIGQDDKKVDISVHDFMKLDDATTLNLVGYIGEAVRWPEKEVELDPYFLGRLLQSPVIMGENEIQIMDKLIKWVENFETEFPQFHEPCEQGEQEQRESHKMKRVIQCEQYLNRLADYNLLNNRHIPKEYLLNSEEIRVKLLFGIIDAGDFKNVIIDQKDQRFADDVIFLAKSLGFLCCGSDSSEEIDQTIKIPLSEEMLKGVSAKIFGRDCENSLATRSTGNLTVEEVESGDFIGLKTDGNSRFLLNDFTVVHNCNIFSTNFTVEVVDSVRKLKYTQHFKNNMYDKKKAKIEESAGPSYTKITFTPDYAKFGVDGLTDDMYALFMKRSYDIAACTSKKVKVYLNNEKLEVSSFEDYMGLFYQTADSETEFHTIYEGTDRWKVGAVYDSSSGYRHISYVNGICTFQGGRHVEHVMDQILTGLNRFISTKHKNITIKNSQIRDHLTVFIDATIEDPSFNSQVKEYLTTGVAKFGSRCELSEEFIKNLAKTGIVEEVVNFAKMKAMAEMKKTDGKKTKSVKGLAKLEDAHEAGKRKASQCRLILTEGDSAKSFAVSGTAVIGKELYGIFPLKGKLLNVREATAKQLLNNEEIKNIKHILGLKHGKKYTEKNINELRYGGIIILTDQDTDGFHIKGLLMNFIQFFWPSLMKVDGFIQSMSTPIIKAWKNSDTKKNNPKIFYTLTDYDRWIKTVNNKNWTSKYYKGLGTHTPKEAKECFNDFEKRLIKYVWSTNGNEEEEVEEDGEQSEECIDTQSQSYDAIMLAFAKTRVNDRKNWLLNYDKDEILQNTEIEVTFEDFINKELKHFSNYDNIRSIPSICDGLKPSQRKILYGAILRGLFRFEIKVSQLAGFVSDKADYHHGEESLHGAIIGMAQNFIGSNNLNILIPSGQFGDRIQGGKNHASPRYIFTQINELTKLIFNKKDDCVLDYEFVDGQKLEPTTYAPIIPMIFANGTKGIGTGFSTDIPCFNPKDIINNIKRMLKGKELKEMIPWYMGFKGVITKEDATTFKTTGLYEIINTTTVRVTELPIGVWTENYKQYLESIEATTADQKGKLIDSFQNDSGNNTIDIKIKFLPGILQKLRKNNEIEKVLKLSKTIRISNMHLHAPDGSIKKYKTINEVIVDFYRYRLEIYEKRKAYYTLVLKNELDLIKWKVKFLENVIAEKIMIMKGKAAIPLQVVIDRLEELNFPKLATRFDDPNKKYDYLTNMPWRNLTEEELEKLKEELEYKKAEYRKYVATTLEEFWMEELLELEKAYNKWLPIIVDNLLGESENKNKNNKPKSKSKRGR